MTGFQINRLCRNPYLSLRVHGSERGNLKILLFTVSSNMMVLKLAGVKSQTNIAGRSISLG
jgi:hypothetical protein